VRVLRCCREKIVLKPHGQVPRSAFTWSLGVCLAFARISIRVFCFICSVKNTSVIRTAIDATNSPNAPNSRIVMLRTPYFLYGTTTELILSALYAGNSNRIPCIFSVSSIDDRQYKQGEYSQSAERLIYGAHAPNTSSE